MTNPTAELDARFSDPTSTATDWSVTSDLLAGAQLSWISTVRGDGRPHVTPLVAVWLDDAVHFTTGAQEQKAVNIAGNPSVVVTTGCNSWEDGIDVMVEGTAVRVTDQAALVRLAAAWRTKWAGQWDYTVTAEGFAHEAGEALVYRVEPAKVLAFGKGDSFSHTRYRFDT